jgi:hypothetical protein
MIIAQSIQDTRVRDRWVREGPPADARLVDLVYKKQRNPAYHRVCVIVEHDSFDPVPGGAEIPTQPVLLIDVKAATAIFTSDDPPPSY